ncbi:MAG: 50S ribosomal protein L15 [Elusimicrobia bacterium]|nr:50S ribosomal protein L15 [Elusimicrobiota bacterium]MDE2236409.1 50S ribosomal protein L15 [Elusimicrobiota bacterium]MDE2425328.1 50S ribosomal protein L15 [Elusimicrobiota bacterium]
MAKKKAPKKTAIEPVSLSQLKPMLGARRRRIRLGFGEGSGHGQTATRGQKGQRSRSGDGKLVGFEGGQTPLLRRVPKRGFTNGAFKTVYQVVSLESIERVFKNQKDVTLDALKIHGLICGGAPVKVLGDGELTRPLAIAAHAFSASAKAKIEKAGGKPTVVARER